MATRYAVATGNWSSTATWDGLTTLPGTGDDVYSDGKTVTIDQDITVLSLRNTNRGGGTTGGGFTVSTNRTITLTGNGITSFGSAVLTTSGTAVVALNSNVNAPSSSSVGITHGSSGTLTITGNILTASGGTNVHNVSCTSGPLVVVGNVTGGGGTTSNAINSTGASASVTITGTITGGTNSPAVLVSGATAVLTVTGNITAGSGGSNATAAVSLSGNSLTKWHSIVGNVTATNSTGALGNHGILDTNTGGGGVSHSGSLIDSSQGDCAINARRYRCVPTLLTTRQHTSSTSYPSGGLITYGSLDYIPANLPTPANVRSGIVYGDSGSFTGTCAVPAAASVAYGVAVDATTGTAALAPADVAALVGAQIVAALNSTP